MLKVVVPPQELWDSNKREFITRHGGTLTLEHSLISLSKWESIWEKPFLTDKNKTMEEYISYIKCMSMTAVDDSVYEGLTQKNLTEIDKYIARPMTATTFPKDAFSKGKHVIRGEQITAELLYYYMFSFQIPKECEKWHLSRLTTLIKLFAVKQEKPKKMSARDAAAERRMLNEQRKAKYHTRG